jgi:DNA uptake protein ComE-like DNA-binding protein
MLRARDGSRSDSRGGERGSTFVIVLWIAFGLVSVALYFGYSMSYELRAADNRVSGQAAEQAIEGAVRYINNLLAYQSSYGSNGVLPDVASYVSEAVPVGEARFWLIGRDTNTLSGPGQLTFGLVDEASKINLNAASSNMLAALIASLPNANQDLAAAVLDWRNTNGPAAFQSYYSSGTRSYQTKSSPFETIEELRLVYGGDLETLVGEDANRNGILDPNENDINHNGQVDPGLLEYVTVYSREPNTYSNGVARVSIRTITGSTGPLPSLLRSTLGSTRATQILVNLGLIRAGPTGGGGGGATPPVSFTSPLAFYRRSRMTAEEFGQIANMLTMTNGTYIEGRINVNTACAAVLACLPGLDTSPDVAQTLVTYRQSNPDKIGSIAWIVDALGQNTNSILPALQAVDCMTTQSYQATADVAAVGPNGRGYRRARFVFDTSDGTPKVVYRQDLTQAGWALGREIRDSVVLAKATR